MVVFWRQGFRSSPRTGTSYRASIGRVSGVVLAVGVAMARVVDMDALVTVAAAWGLVKKEHEDKDL